MQNKFSTERRKQEFESLADGKSGDLDLERLVLGTMYEYFLLWQKKQASYGPRNIGDFGAAGCLIRLNDKVQRLRRKYYMHQEETLDDETTEDTWFDAMGYSLMGLMNQRNQWPK